MEIESSGPGIKNSESCAINGTVTINCTSSASYGIQNSNSVTINNEITIVCTKANSYGIYNSDTIVIENDAKVTITITRFTSYCFYNSAAAIVKGQITVIRDYAESSFTGYYYGIYNTETGNFTIDGKVLAELSGTRWIPIYNYGNFTLNGTVTCSDNWNSIENNGGTFTTTIGSFLNVTSSRFGLYNFGSATFIINGTATLVNNAMDADTNGAYCINNVSPSEFIVNGAVDITYYEDANYSVGAIKGTITGTGTITVNDDPYDF